FVPKFEPMFQSLVDSGKDLPIATVWLLAFRNFCGKYGLYALGVMFVLFVGARIQMKTKAGRRAMDRWKLKLPVMGPVAQGACVSKLCRVLGDAPAKRRSDSARARN
ncbi:MAG: hypothetical protein IJ387_02690, partial [Thermoguttaceae bacterium]|nr:hypothetical protein [Thermoguttaceae bacterium]